MPPEQLPFVAGQHFVRPAQRGELTIESDKTVYLADSADPVSFSRAPSRVNANERLMFRYENRDVPPIPGDPTRLHIQNREIDPATVVFTFKYIPTIPQASTIVGDRDRLLLADHRACGVSSGRTARLGAGVVDRQERDGPAAVPVAAGDRVLRRLAVRDLSVQHAGR